MRSRRKEQGAYAIEFALVFLVFFMVIYAVLTYGLLFTAQQVMNHAAEDSARKALAWSPSLEGRMETARRQAQEQTAWIAKMSALDDLDIQVCHAATAGKEGAGNCAAPPEAGQLQVRILYPYRAAPLIPVLAGFLVPEFLRAEATVSMDIAAVAAHR